MSAFSVTKRWLYQTGRPNRVTSWINAGWAKLASAGFGPERMATLEVKGRRSGRCTALPVMIADLEGQRYLVSMLGEGANWVANVRAAGGHALLKHGITERVLLREVETERRAPILKRYLAVAAGARPHIPVDPSAPISDFERIAAAHPVFRIDTDTSLG